MTLMFMVYPVDVSIETANNRRRNLPPSPRLREHVHYLLTAKQRKFVQYQGYG